jgi:ubiquinone/menaquinone biosynthesis C-methylase UbiE
MDYMDGLKTRISYGNALDFGCGVGRLTQGLCHHFNHVTGVDISNTMIDGAMKFNKFGKKCTYITNTEPHLKCLGTNTFDFVYTNIVLQHMPPRYQVEYIKEFFRILKPGGIALFQVRTAKGNKSGSLAEKIYNFKMERWKPFWKIVRGRPPIQVHTISPQVVEEAINECGASLLDIQVSDKRIRKSLRYCAMKPI